MTKRLVGPTAIAVLLFLVLTQQLFFGDGSWSVLGILRNALTIMVAVLTPSELVSSFFDSYVSVPISVAVLALIVLWTIIARARRANRSATDDEEAPIWELPITGDNSSKSQPLADTPEISWSLQAFRFNCLRSKLILGFLAISLLVALAGASFAYSYLQRAVERGAKARAAITAMAVNAMAVWHI